MLLIETEIKPCKYGFGLFCKTDIKKDTIIWMFNPILDKAVSFDSLQYLEKTELDFLEKYAYNDGKQLIICTDLAKFFNHDSVHFNCNDWIHPVFGSVTSAKRFIQAGEELTSDYSQFDSDYHLYKDKLL